MAKGTDRRKNKTPPPPKQKGAKDKVPGQRKIRASVKSIIVEVVEKQKSTVRGAIVRGLKSGPRDAHHYLKLAAEYTDGKPDQKLSVQFDEDELATAKESLHKKLDTLLKRIEENAARSEPPTE